MVVLGVCLLLFFLVSLALFSGMETAFFSLSSMQVKTFKRDTDPRKRLVAFLLTNPGELLITLIILIIVSSLLVQSAVSMVVGKEKSWGLHVGIPLLLNLILGEVIPKSLAMPNNVQIAYRTARLLAILQTWLFPIRKLLSWMTGLVMPFLLLFFRKEKEISLDELQHALKDSKDRGVLLEEETELIRGYLRLQESTVKELMRPREEILCFDVDEPLTRLVHLFVDQECSRILLCDGGLDGLKGVISSRAFFQQRPLIKEPKDLMPFLKAPYFVPETLKADVLLTQLYERKESLAVVVNEYGSITGLIAMEDLVEEVVGEIVDRRDREAFFTRAGADVIIASSKLELTEFEEIFGIPLKSPTHRVTVGGWLMEQLGEIPKPGTKYQTKELFFHVLAADVHRIRRIYIRRLKSRGKHG